MRLPAGSVAALALLAAAPAPAQAPAGTTAAAAPGYRLIWRDGTDYAAIETGSTHAQADGTVRVSVTRHAEDGSLSGLDAGSDDPALAGGAARTAVVEYELHCAAEKLRVVGYTFQTAARRMLAAMPGEAAAHLGETSQDDAILSAGCQRSPAPVYATIAAALAAGDDRQERQLLDNKLRMADVDRAPADRTALQEEAFGAAQWAMTSDTAAALAGVAARFAQSDGPLAVLERRRAALVSERRTAARAYTQAIAHGPSGQGSSGQGSSGQAAEIGRLGRLLTAADDAITAIDVAVNGLDPAYAELARPTPLTLRQVQALLAPDEGLLVMLPTVGATYLFGISREKVSWARSDGLGEQALARQVQTLREQAQRDVNTGGLSFDRALAYGLYQKLVAPVEDAIWGKTIVMTVGSGPLDALPMQMLVAAPPTGASGDAAAAQATTWLADRYALSMLPAVSSLRSLRCLLVPATRRAAGCEGVTGPGRPAVAADAGRMTLVGIGAPLTGVRATSPVAAGPRGRTGGMAVAAGGELADVDVLRGLPYLNGSAAELEAMARIVGPDHATLMAGAAARERDVKASAAVASARFLIFSTHGLLATDLEEVGEPGLVLTPPTMADRSATDDGLLTASEAAQLTLSADFVVLSACNTAAADGTPGADGLSGLARGFLFAGARSLLVSHWEVSDQATVTLMGALFEAVQRTPGIDRAVALQAAMRTVRAQAKWASPGLWAPFTLIGVGN